MPALKLTTVYTDSSTYDEMYVVNRYSTEVWNKLLKRSRSIVGSDGIPGIKLPAIKTSLQMDERDIIQASRRDPGDELLDVDRASKPDFEKYRYVTIFHTQFEQAFAHTEGKARNLGKVIGSIETLPDDYLLRLAVGH